MNQMLVIANHMVKLFDVKP